MIIDLKAVHNDKQNKYSLTNKHLDKSSFIKDVNAAKHDPDKEKGMFDADFPAFKYN